MLKANHHNSHSQICQELKDPSNYKPISLLNNLGKLLEKIITNRLICFIKSNMGHSSQYAADIAVWSTSSNPCADVWQVHTFLIVVTEVALKKKTQVILFYRCFRQKIRKLPKVKIKL